MTEVHDLARAARAVAPQAAALTTNTKNAVLLDAANALVTHTEELCAANEHDLVGATDLSFSLRDRLRLDPERIKSIAHSLEQVADLADPIGTILRDYVLENGLHMRQIRVPLGVMGMVYEARPNVTVDAFGLALKSGNVALLRGSNSAYYTNEALVKVLRGVLESRDLPGEFVSLVPSASHDSVQELINARGLVDVVIPRGSANLINAVVQGATVPTIETGTGNCHLFIHASADIDQAIGLVINGKTRRPSVCNATETLLLDAALSTAVRTRILDALTAIGVTIHGDATELAFADAVPATDEDWAEEYLSMDIAAKVVAGVDGAIAHIARWSSGHTEAIAATDAAAIKRFADEVDAAAVMINASTAFTDGEVFGMGAEIGISTQKLHARGPMALPELTSTKWVVEGNGQVRP